MQFKSSYQTLWRLKQCCVFTYFSHWMFSIKTKYSNCSVTINLTTYIVGTNVCYTSYSICHKNKKERSNKIPAFLGRYIYYSSMYNYKWEGLQNKTSFIYMWLFNADMKLWLCFLLYVLWFYGFTRVSGNFVVWAGFYWSGRVLRCDWAGNCQSDLATLPALLKSFSLSFHEKATQAPSAHLG